MSDDMTPRTTADSEKRTRSPDSWLNAKSGREKGTHSCDWNEQDKRFCQLIAFVVLMCGVLGVVWCFKFITGAL